VSLQVIDKLSGFSAGFAYKKERRPEITKKRFSFGTFLLFQREKEKLMTNLWFFL
jgi:hypothetical protein